MPSASEALLFPGALGSASPDPLGGRGLGELPFGPGSKLVVPAGMWVATTAGGLAIFLLFLPRRRRGQEPVSVAAIGGGAVALAESAPAPPPIPTTAAPALANVPTLDDESVARWLRPSDDEAAEQPPSSPGSRGMKRRSQSRPRTTRDLQAGS